jgi:hypothetical protein
MDFQNAVVATWFRYAGTQDIGLGQTNEMQELLRDFFNLVSYSETEQAIVQEAIETVVGDRYAGTKVRQVVSDAVYSQLVSPGDFGRRFEGFPAD